MQILDADFEIFRSDELTDIIEGDNEHFYNHPLIWLCERVESLTGIDRNVLETMAYRLNTPIGLRRSRNQESLQYLVPELRKLDQDGITQNLVGELERLWPAFIENLLRSQNLLLDESGAYFLGSEIATTDEAEPEKEKHAEKRNAGTINEGMAGGTRKESDAISTGQVSPGEENDPPSIDTQNEVDIASRVTTTKQKSKSGNPKNWPLGYDPETGDWSLFHKSNGRIQCSGKVDLPRGNVALLAKSFLEADGTIKLEDMVSLLCEPDDTRSQRQKERGPVRAAIQGFRKAIKNAIAEIGGIQVEQTIELKQDCYRMLAPIGFVMKDEDSRNVFLSPECYKRKESMELKELKQATFAILYSN